MMRVNGLGAAAAVKRLWRVVSFAAAGAIGISSQAEAAIYYWQNSDPGAYQENSDPGVSRPGHSVPPRRQKARRHVDKKIELAEKESAKPQGPLIIAID